MSLKNILPKLFAVKQKMGTVSKDAKNPFFKSNYADLNSHLELIEPLLAEQGLVMLQPVTAGVAGGADSVSTIIYDKDSGESVSSSITIQGKDMQQLGAAVTYGRRFTVGALFGMQAVDDDGNYASGKTQELKAGKTTTVSAGQVSVTTAGSPTVVGATEVKPSFRRPKPPGAQATTAGDDL